MISSEMVKNDCNLAQYRCDTVNSRGRLFFFCSKLMVVLKSYIESMDATKVDLLCRTMKSLGYIFKFIIRSRFLFAAYVLI